MTLFRSSVQVTSTVGLLKYDYKSFVFVIDIVYSEYDDETIYYTPPI